MSDTFIQLHPRAKMLYVYMKLWAGGKKSFYYSYSLGLRLFASRSTFKSAIDELVLANMLTITKKNGKNLYTFVN